MPLPTIGPRQAGEVRISPRLRRRLARRTYSLARREYLPALRADRAALRSVKKARRRDVQSAYGATKLATRSIKAAQNQLGSSGLSGIFRQEAGQELSAQRGDVAAGTPDVIAGVRQQYQSPISQARSSIIGDRATIAKEAASGFASELSKARTQGRSFLAKQGKQRGKAKAHKRNVEATQRGLSNAVKLGVSMLLTGPPGQPKKSGLSAAQWALKAIPHSDAEWQGFEASLAAREGVTPQQARAAVKRIQNKRFYSTVLARLASDVAGSAFGG